MCLAGPGTAKPGVTQVARRRPAAWHWGLVAVLALLFLSYYGALALRKHDALITGADLADADQAVWWTVNGQPFKMTTKAAMDSRLGIHVEPILLALVPIYALFPSATTLIVVQAIALTLAAVPLYALAADALGPPTLALAIPLLYYLSPAVHNAVLADFYPVTLGVLPAMAALFFVWRGQTRAALLLAGIALLAREDYGLWLAALAFVGWWRTRDRAWIVAGLAGLAWFLVVTLAIIPTFVRSEQSLLWDRYLFWLQGTEAWHAQGYLSEKARYLLLLLLMGGVGVLLAPLWALPALPVLALNLLSNFALPVSLDSYYSILIVPTFLAALAIGLRRFDRRWRVVVLVALLGTSLWVHVKQGRSPLVPAFYTLEPVASGQALPAVLAHLPAGARLSASPGLAPHVSGREYLRIFPQAKGTDYLLLDLLRDRRRHPIEVRRRVYDRLDAGWGVLAGQDGFLLLAAGTTNREIPQEFYAFAWAEGTPQYPAREVFGETFELMGYDLVWDYWGRPIVRLYWRVLQAPQTEWQPAALALDAAGEILTTPDTHTPVALLWLPTQFWRPGQTYVVETLPFDAPDRVTLLVGAGAPLADPATRLETATGLDLVPLADLERHGRGWRVHPHQP